MANNYPGSVDTSVGAGPPATGNARTTTTTADATYDHSQRHQDLSDAVVALETMVGATNSTDPNSLVNQVSGLTANPLLAAANTQTGLALQQFPANMVVQRTSLTGGPSWAGSKGTGPLTLGVASTLPILTLDYRLRDASANGNPTLQDWTPAQYAVSAGTSTITLQAIPARNGWYFLDVRANGSNAQISLGTTPVGCGEVTLVAGGVVALDFLNNTVGGDATTVAGAGVTVSPLTSAYASTGNSYPADNTALPTWGLVGDGGPYPSAGVTEYLRAIQAHVGVPCAAIGHCIGSSPISSWAPGQSFNTTLKNIVNKAGGGFGTFLWIQGHADAAAGITGSAWTSGLSAILSDLAASFPAVSFARLICSIPAYGGTTGGTPAQVSAIRLGGIQYAATDNKAAYIDGLGMTMNADLITPSQAGSIVLGRSFYRAFRRIRLGETGNTGPHLVRGTRVTNSASVSLQIAHDKGTDIVVGTGAADQFAVFASGDTVTPLPITAISRTDPTHLQLTLATPPDNALALGVRYRDMYLDTNAIVGHSVTDNWTGFGDDNITTPSMLRLTASELTVAAPGSSTVVAPGSATPTLTVPLVAQYDASAANVLYSDSGRTTFQSTNTGAVAAWDDTSGNGRHLTNTQGSPTLPSLLTNSQNGLPGVHFNGTAKQYVRNVLTSNWSSLQSSGITMLVVWKITSNPTFFAAGGLYSNGNGNNALNLFGVEVTNTVANSGLVRPMRNTATASVSGGPLYPGNNILMKTVVRFDVVNNLVYCATNALTEASVASTGPYTGTGLAAWNTFALGEVNQRFLSLDGTVYESAVWNGFGSSADRDALLTYAGNKWGS